MRRLVSDYILGVNGATETLKGRQQFDDVIASGHKELQDVTHSIDNKCRIVANRRFKKDRLSHKLTSISIVL